MNFPMFLLGKPRGESKRRIDMTTCLGKDETGSVWDAFPFTLSHHDDVIVNQTSAYVSAAAAQLLLLMLPTCMCESRDWDRGDT